MMNPQERKRQERQARRHRIQDAARPVFFERGFARTSIEDIAKQAQLSVGAIYLYFKSKEDLTLTCQTVETGKACLESWRAAEPESARALLMVARPELRATLSAEVTDGLAQSLGRIRRGLIEAVAQAIAARAYRSCDADAVGDALWAGFAGGLSVDAMLGNVGGATSAGAATFAVLDGNLRATQSVRAAA